MVSDFADERSGVTRLGLVGNKGNLLI
jgi:hypothetical protein